MAETAQRFLPVSELTLHPAFAPLPKGHACRKPTCAAFMNLCDIVSKMGIKTPIPVNQYRVCGDVDLWEAAKTMGIKNVPVVEVPAPPLGVKALGAHLPGGRLRL